MNDDNIFAGRGEYSMLPHKVYSCLMSREWITYADVMAEFKFLESAKDLPCSVSKCEGYGELKKFFSKICRMIRKRVGEDCIEEDGNNRNKRFRYIGKDNDPLADMINVRVINSLRQYYQFCQDSAGFFPISWLEYFFKDCRDLLNIKSKREKGEQVLSASLDRMLTNIEMLPSLYVAIIKKQVLSVDYKPYGEEVRTLTFHPHYLKEYNGRWHLFGHAEEQTPEFGCNIALDRICAAPRELYNVEYKPAPKGFYENFFKDIVGVSHMKDLNSTPYQVRHIYIRAHTNYIYNLTATKKIHPSQDISVPFGDHEDGTYGEFVVNVELNNEFIGRILQMGAGLEIVSPEDVREIFRQRVEALVKLYE